MDAFLFFQFENKVLTLNNEAHPEFYSKNLSDYVRIRERCVNFPRAVKFQIAVIKDGIIRLQSKFYPWRSKLFESCPIVVTQALQYIASLCIFHITFVYRNIYLILHPLSTITIHNQLYRYSAEKCYQKWKIFQFRTIAAAQLVS